MKLLFLNKTKKNIAWFLCLAFILNLFFLAPNSAKAIPVNVTADVNTPAFLSIDGFAAAINGETATLAATQTKTNLWQNIVVWAKTNWYQIQDTITQKSMMVKEYVLDPIAWTAANVIIDQFGDALVDWIRNGFEGSPMFLSDPEGFFRDTANQFSGAIIDALDMEWLCDPLGKLRLNIDFFFPGTDRAKYACTFNDIADTFESYADRDDLSDWINVNVNVRERNIVRAYGSDYRNGGFLMWLFTAQKKNNDLGRTIQTANDAFMAASVSVASEKFQLNLGRGFFGVKKCVEWESTYEAYQPFEKTSQGAGNGKCKKYEIQTPGALVQDQLNDVAGKDLSRLQVADEIDEIIGALATTMMGWLLTGGNDGGGVLGYDSSNKNYAGSQRDHYGNLRESQQTTTKKSNISGQIVSIKSNEEQYGNSLENYAESLFGTKEKLEIILAKLKCIKATSTSDASDNADCDGADEDIKNISLSAMDKTEDDITSDISKTEDKISDIESKISSFTGKYGDNATSTSAQALELFDEFENKVMSAVNLDEGEDEIENLKGEYCYSYDKTNDTGEICGLFGDSATYETYKTHNNEKDYQPLNEDIEKIKTEMDNIMKKYVCIINDYTKAEEVNEAECRNFKSSSSSSSSSE